MKVSKRYLLFFVLGCFTIIFYQSFLKEKKLILSQLSNNLSGYVEDSIKPTCSPISDNKYIVNEKIEIIIPESRKWSKNLLQAKLKVDSKTKIINTKYKKEFNGFILINTNKDNSFCKLKAKIRISGDASDHIKLLNKDVVSSLDVKLQEGNINGITRFKLFLPESRKGSSEIITVALFKSMGYLAPRTKLINVTVNDVNLEMIMQEKASKEMIENNKLRESAILGIDESVMWNLRSLTFKDFNALIYPKLINFKWFSKNINNPDITIKAFKIFSKAISESWNKGDYDHISYSDILLANGNEKGRHLLSKYKLHLLAMKGDHGLANHNRRFYYDAFNDYLLPIYYDGNTYTNFFKRPLYFNKIFESEIESYKSKEILRDVTVEDINKALSELNNIDKSILQEDLKLSGVSMKINEIYDLILMLSNNLKFLRRHIAKNSSLYWGRNPLTRYTNKSIKYGLIFSNDGEKFEVCNLENQTCNNSFLSDNQKLDVYRGRYRKEGMIYYYMGDSSLDYQNKLSLENKELNIKKLDFKPLNIFIKGSPQINIDEKNKLISINISNFKDKIIIDSSLIINWDIKVSAAVNNIYIEPESRYDTNLLTSMLTIQDSTLRDVNIDINGGELEDSLNIIRSEGHISRINVRNSFQDAVDFDFSNLKVDKVNISNSGNDCIDFSSGRYFINKLNLKNCSDKAVSAGEGSLVNINTADIDDSLYGFVSKDSSAIDIKNAIISGTNICVAAYRKKEEFSGSILKIPSNICSIDQNYIQEYSSVIEK